MLGFLCQISHSVPLAHPHLFFPVFFFFFFFWPLLSLSCLIFIPLSPVPPPWKGALIVLCQPGVDCPGQPAPSDSPLAPGSLPLMEWPHSINDAFQGILVGYLGDFLLSSLQGFLSLASALSLLDTNNTLSCQKVTCPHPLAFWGLWRYCNLILLKVLFMTWGSCYLVTLYLSGNSEKF